VFSISFRSLRMIRSNSKSDCPTPLAGWRRGAVGVLYALSFVSAETAYAHKVNVFAYLEGNQVYVQGYFMDGKKAKNSTVRVYGKKGEQLMEGLTNDDGEYVFPISAKQEMRIVLNAGQGHQAEYALSSSELTGDATQEQGSSAEGVDVTQSAAVGGDIEAVVRRAVAAGMMPLAKEIAELKEQRSFSDVIGGVGFIAGLLGVLAYVKSRKQVK